MTKPTPTIDDFAGEWSDHFDSSIKSETTRAKVILSACYLDELLHQLISIALKPTQEKKDPLLDGATAPLGTFSAKIEIASRMMLIPEETKKSLHFVRKIRNRFAHDLVDVDFTDPQIDSWNKELDRLNDVATEDRRGSFSEGPIGDFEKSVSWLIYYIRHLTRKIPSSCPCCGSEMEHREKLKSLKPGESH